MKKIRKEDVDQGVFDLYDAYAHNQIDRREFMDRLSTYAVGGITLMSLMSFIMPDYKNKRQVGQDDPRLDTHYITYHSPDGGGDIKALLARPAGSQVKKLPGIVVVHENRGLNPHIEDVCRRAALEGYIALAPDALTPLGGYPGNDDDGRALQRQRDRYKMLEDFISGFKYLKSHEDCTGKVGVVGFCFGGWISNMMAIRLPELGAAVPFYGGQPPADLVSDLQVPVMLQYAGLDERVNKGWPAYEAALLANDKQYKVHFYPDVNHGFHNDTTPRYDEASAKLAWQRTMAFFDRHLKE